MNKGPLFAFGAAFLNALVGVLSLTSFATGLSAPHVAFYKCIAAFGMLSLLVCLRKTHRHQIRQLMKHAHQLAIMAFFGFFCLYFFETKAYTENSVAIIVFTLLATSAITTFIASYFLANDSLDARKIVCMLLAILGLMCFSLQSSFTINFGLICAGIAGSGYGLFLVLNNRFKLPIHGIPLLWWLTLFGVVYLAVPFFLTAPQLPSLASLPSILLLGIAPTIGGFYCTTKALSYSYATEVQLFEFAEPVIASLLAFIFYHQYIRYDELLGAFMITCAIFISVKNIFPRKQKINIQESSS